MSSRTRRNLLLAAVAVAVWYVCVLFFWALKPLEDSVPIGVDQTVESPVLTFDPAATPTSITIECNTLFASTPGPDGPVPPMPGPYLVFNRAPCEAVQRDARIVFALDTVVAIVLVGGLVFGVARYASRHDAQYAIA